MKGLRNTKMEKDDGILCCINCIGIHPDEPIKKLDIMNRLHKPQRVVANQLMRFEAKRKLGVYNNKSCMLCGRTYSPEGNLDESWELTKARVKEEFEHAGVDGVSDEDLNKVVASCAKSWRLLWRNRKTINPEDAEMMTFVGRLTLIITHAQEAREKRNEEKKLNKGLIV